MSCWGSKVEAPALVNDLAVMLEAEPIHPLQNRLDGFRRRTRAVGVFNPQAERATVALRV